MIIHLIETVYSFLWGDLFTIPLKNSSIGISLMLQLLIPAGIYFTIRTHLLPIRLFPDMLRALSEKKEHPDNLSSLQTLIISTATRVGMGNLVGVVAAVSLGGAGAVFWMWVTALIGSSTAFVEAVLAQKYKEPDPLYGGYHGGPAYYIHHFVEEKTGRKTSHSLIACLFAISGLICWCGISQVISNSVSSAFENAFQIPPLVTTIILVILSAVIAVQLHTTIVSIRTPSAWVRPVRTGSLLWAAAAAHGADPEPASFEKSPRLTPFISTAPKPPETACRSPNASEKMREKTDGRSVRFRAMMKSVITKNPPAMIGTRMSRSLTVAFR